MTTLLIGSEQAHHKMPSQSVRLSAQAARSNEGPAPHDGGFLVYEPTDVALSNAPLEIALSNAPLCLHCAMPRLRWPPRPSLRLSFVLASRAFLSPVACSYDVRRFRALRASWTGFEARFD